MDSFTWDVLDSTAELRAAAEPWDDLWRRAAATLPTSRAALVSQWLDHFAPGCRFRAVVARSPRGLVAALPLYSARRGMPLVGRLPGNAWSTAGELLLDENADATAACDNLVTGLQRLGWPIVELGGVATQTMAWQSFRAALERRRLRSSVSERFRVEQVEITGDWQHYLARRSRNQRRHIRRAQTKAEQAGPLHLRVVDKPPSADLATCLQTGFDIEDRGWKGAAGTSVLKSPGAFDFYLEQARLLAELGHLRLAFLEHRGRPIAFEYGWMSKGVYYTPKVGYDERAGQLSPGFLLRSEVIADFHATGGCRLVDYLGPSSRATADWSTRSYPVARVLFATRPAGRIALGAYELLKLVRRSLWRRPSIISTVESGRGETEPSVENELGAETEPGSLVEPAIGTQAAAV